MRMHVSDRRRVSPWSSHVRTNIHRSSDKDLTDAIVAATKKRKQVTRQLTTKTKKKEAQQWDFKHKSAINTDSKKKREI